MDAADRTIGRLTTQGESKPLRDIGYAEVVSYRYECVRCPCCLGAGKVMSDQEVRPCPSCEGYKTVPKEVARRFLEVLSRRLRGGETG